MYSHVYPCIAMYTHVMPCIAMYTHVMPCQLITTLMCNQFSPGLPNQLESARVNIGMPVVRTDGRTFVRCTVK